MCASRVLVVDDDRSSREVVAKLLSSDGYKVDVAADGPTALELMDRAPYDLAVLDYQMPGMSGVDTFRKAREVCPDIRGIFITAYANINTVFPAIDAGVERVLAKPLNARELLSVVAEILSGDGSHAAPDGNSADRRV
ncbi:MAG: response regulator [Planctomycetia bacterium]|nr:response regulator [Planctomycetia bacterium]